MTVVRLAAIQLGPSSSDLEANRHEVTTRVTEAASDGAQLVVLPELALNPYFGARPAGATNHWASAVGTGDAEFFARLSAVAGVHLVGPFFEQDARSGLNYNAAVLTDPAGGLNVSTDRNGQTTLTDRKLHLPVSDLPPCDEGAHFHPGETLGVHRVGGMTVGCLICYDRRFPECWRELRTLGADIVAVPVAGSGGDPDGYFLAELRTHAKENGVVVIAANKVGTEVLDGAVTENTGDSCIIDAAGVIVALRTAAQGPGVVMADINLEEIAEVRRHHRAFEHRRVDLFPPPVATVLVGAGGMKR